jgi:hypothetical protein
MDLNSLNQVTSKAPALTPEFITGQLPGCPVCGYRKTFAVFWNDDGTIGVHCYSNTHDRKSLIDELKARGLWPNKAGTGTKRSLAELTAARIAEASAVWAAAVPITETNAASMYLASRGLKPPWPDTIRAEVTYRSVS